MTLNSGPAVPTLRRAFLSSRLPRRQHMRALSPTVAGRTANKRQALHASVVRSSCFAESRLANQLLQIQQNSQVSGYPNFAGDCAEDAQQCPERQHELEKVELMTLGNRTRR